MRLPCCRNVLALLVLAAACATGTAHELQANRLTLVQREAHHLSLSLHLDYLPVLHRTLAPRQDYREFVLAHAAMEHAQLAAALQRAQAAFEASTRLTLPDGSALPVQRWRWPEARRVQALLQQQAMRWIAGPGDHAHDDPIEVPAECVSRSPIRSVQVQLPAAFDAVLVVSYRPRQAWARPATGAIKVEF